MAQGNVNQASGHSYTLPSGSSAIKYRTTNSGNPLAHNDVDANFELLRAAVNGIVSDISGVAGKTVGTDVPVGAVFTDTTYNHPNHTGDVTSVGDGATTIASGAVTEAKLATGAVTTTKIANNAITSTQIATGAVTSNEIATGAVTTNKIANNSITTEQLVTEGTNSISLTQVVPKTLIVHVGNYYDRDGTQQLASDALNYNSSNDTYGFRTVKTVDFATNHPNGWLGYHYDTDSAETVEPFATCVAAIRYALHNFGMGCYLQMVVHGHVSWFGEYDMGSSTSSSIKDAGQMDAFAGFSLLGGAPGTYSGSDSAWAGYPTVTARIDVDCNGRPTIAPGMWFRGPRIMWSGINFVCRKTDSGDIGFWTSGSNVGFHEIRGMRYASLDQPSGGYIYPFHWIEGAQGFVSSSANNPLEFYVSRNMTVFHLVGQSDLLISNNATTNDHFFEGQNANIGVRYSGLWGNSQIRHKHAQVYIKSGSSFDRTINTFGMNGGFCKTIVESLGTNVAQHVPGNGTMSYGTFDSTLSIYDTSDLTNNGGSISATNLTYSGYPSNGLYSKWGTSSYVSSLTALSPGRLAGNSSFKSKPASRTNDTYPDQK